MDESSASGVTNKRRAHFIANGKSGQGQGQRLREIARRVSAQLGIDLVDYTTDDPSAFENRVASAVRAAKEDGGRVVAAGGDGTIRSMAQKAAEAGVPMGIVACGTFNFFARGHRLPEDPEAALRVALTAEPRPVRLGKLNDHYFLSNASLGLYAKTVRQREEHTRRYGRQRLVVIFSTLKTALSKQKNLHVDLISGDKSVKMRTQTIFIGNNALQLRGLAMDVAHCMKLDLLAVVLLKPVSRLEMLRIFWRGIAKTLEREEKLETFCVSRLTIELPHKEITVALDGELFKLGSPIRIEAVPEALSLALPSREAA